MKIIALIMLVVFALDMLAAIFFMHSWIAGILLALAFGAMYLLRPKKPAKAPEVGWNLGPAIELTNPESPTRLESAYIHPKVLNLGMLFIGSPGSGKTVTSLGYIEGLPKHSPGSGWAYFEGKGDTDIYRKCVAMGCAPDHFFSTEQPGSETINLFAGAAHDVIDRLGKVLIGETSSTSFYSDEQRAVLSRIVPLLRALPEATNLRDLYVSLTVQDAGNELLRRAQEAGANPVDVEMAKAWLAQPMKDRLKNISGLLNRLFIFVHGPYADRLNAYQPDIDIEAVVSANKSIYLHLPLTAFARDVAIAIVETFGVVARKRQNAGAENFRMYPQLFDDWGAFFHAGFGPYSARCRSVGMPLSFGFQSRAQLEAVSPTFADELDDTIATKIILCVQGTKTGDYAVTLLGEYETHDLSTSDSNSAGGAKTSTGTGLRISKKWRIETRQLRELQPGEAYICTLAMQDGRRTNPLWKLRFPEPNYKGWEAITMPPARDHKEGEGLSLWSRYMDPATLAEIHATIQADTAEKEKAMTANLVQQRQEAAADIAHNPGFALS